MAQFDPLPCPRAYPGDLRFFPFFVGLLIDLVYVYLWRGIQSNIDSRTIPKRCVFRTFLLQLMKSWGYSSPTTLRQLRFPLKIRSLEIRSHRANRARNVLCIKIETGCLKQFPTPGPEGLDLSRGLPWGGDVNGSNWTMHMSKVFLM